MGYSGASMVDVVDRLEQASARAGHRMAESMQSLGERNIKANTPVETFHLRESYKRSSVRYKRVDDPGIKWAAYCWEGTVYTEVEYAPFVELGTGLWGPKRAKYKIQPKRPGGVLAFTPYSRGAGGAVILDVQGAPLKGGGPVVVRFVMHPGSPGHHMFQIGAELTESQHAEWSMEPLRLWKQEIEGNKRFEVRVADKAFAVRAGTGSHA